MAVVMSKDAQNSNALFDLGFKEGTALQAQFVAQPSSYAQELVYVDEEFHRGIASYAEGKDISHSYASSSSTQMWREFNREPILKHLARAVAEHMSLGVTHGDIHRGNIILSSDSSVPMRLIDYHPSAASPLQEDYVDDFIAGTKRDYHLIKEEIVDFFAKHGIHRMELTDYFDREFERSISRFNGESIG